jgi:8-oxo-dGTP diphosphatase
MTLQLAVEHLLRPRTWWEGRVRVQYRPGLAPARLISRVRVIPFVADGSCVLARSAEFGWMIPGGTREPGESPLETAVREMREEIGGTLLSYRPIGADWCISSGPPYREHLPHPEFCMLYGWGDVELDGPPLPTEDGETIVEVGVFRVDEAIDLLLEKNEGEGAAIVRLAAGDRAAFREGVMP